MNADVRRQAFEIFDEICDLREPERSAVLEERCGEHAGLRREVERMLRADAGADAALPTGEGAAALAEELVRDLGDGSPERIGRYRIIGEIGRGGMGVVYQAEQDDPRRRVALKVIREGFASRETQRRFRRESQLLGQLQHPGIAHVYEAGTETVDGRPIPFFAMEYIEGAPLDVHVCTAAPDRREILQLFVRICDAVQDAHQQGVIHRDLKPANILVKRESTPPPSGSGTASGSGTFVDTVGQPKILDFGVARITDPDPHATLQTHDGQLVGTLAYMSPEQLDGDPAALDSRCDVYAIGVMLYQVLAGRMPVDIAGKPVAEAARLVRESEPKPLGAIDASLRGDLDTIVATAMEADRTRRYPSAAALGDDIRRYLTREPISARPASAMYQLRKCTSRNRALVDGVAVGFVLLIAGVVGTSIGLAAALDANQTLGVRNDELQAATDALEKRNAALEAVAAFQASQFADVDLPAMGTTLRAFLMESVAEDTRPDLDLALGRVNFTTAALRMLDGHVFDRAEEAIDRDFAGQPLVRTRLHHVLARTMRLLGLPESALRVAQRSLAARTAALGAEHEDTLLSASLVGKIFLDLGEYDAADAVYRDVIATRRRVRGDDAVDTLTAMHDAEVVRHQRGLFAEVEDAVRPIVDALIEQAGPDDDRTLTAMATLSTTLADQGKHEEAIEFGRLVVQSRERVLGIDSDRTQRA